LLVGIEALVRMPVVNVDNLVRLQRKADDIRNVRTSSRKLQSMLILLFAANNTLTSD
jgi:hypothetical protein